MSAFHLSVAVTPLVMRTGKGRETVTGCSKPFVQPKRRPRDVSWIHPPSGSWGDTQTPLVHWNWDEHQRQETTLKHDYRTWSPNQTVQPKQSPEPGVASARSDEGDSGIEDDGIQTNSDATVRPVTLPEDRTVVLNLLRKVVYCHVKSGIACFQMPENPELLNDHKFENGGSSGSGDLSQKRRSDCKRKLSNRPEYNKLKIRRDNYPQRSSQYVENQVMVKSPSCWIDPFQTKLDKRRTTKLTRPAEPISRDVIELKQAAFWHAGKILIGQACEAAAEGMVRQPKAPRISFRSEGTRSRSGTHQEHTKSLQTSHSASCVSSSSAVELLQMSGGTCREQSSTDASDSSMCGGNCASRPERASSSSRKVSRRKGNFPVASIPVADIPRSYSFYSPFMSDDSGRNSREETTGSTGDKKSTPLGESGTTGAVRKGKYRDQKPSPTVIPATIDRDLDPSKRPPTGVWATWISDCPHLIEQRAFRENAYLEWMACLSRGARWSRKTGQNDIQVKMGLIIDQPQLTPPCPGCASTTRLQQMTNKTETFFGCSRSLLCNRVENTSLTTESRVSPSAHSCSAAQPMAEQVMVLDSDSVGSEDSFRMLSVPAVPAVSQQEQQFLLEQLRHLSSCGITGQEARRANVRMFPDNQQKIKVSKAVRTWQDTMQKV